MHYVTHNLISCFNTSSMCISALPLLHTLEQIKNIYTSVI